MQVVTVGTKYQIVIPKQIRQKIKGIKPGAKVGVQPAPKNTVTIQPMQGDWVNRSAGIAREAWKNIDPSKELEKMRDEWEEKSKELRNELKTG